MLFARRFAPSTVKQAFKTSPLSVKLSAIFTTALLATVFTVSLYGVLSAGSKFIGEIARKDNGTYDSFFLYPLSLLFAFIFVHIFLQQLATVYDLFGSIVTDKGISNE